MNPYNIIRNTMKFYFALPSLFFLAISCSRQPYRCVPRMHVYSIACHDGSIFFSTADSGVFRFPADTVSAVRRIAAAGHLPIRSIVFGRDGRLYASSYYSGVYYVRNDSLLPLAWAQQPSWSMKFDDDGSLWLAGLHGIYRQQRDSLIKFSAINGGHDIAFCKGLVAIAHSGGISVFDMQTGLMVREFCKGAICWTITRYDTLFIGGGLDLCVIINKESCKKISLGPKKNMLWSTALDPKGALYLGTQEGLYRAEPGSEKAQCIGLRGICIKSLLIDRKGRLWVGRYYKYKK